MDLVAPASADAALYLHVDVDQLGAGAFVPADGNGALAVEVREPVKVVAAPR